MADLPRAHAACRTALVTGACSGIGLAIARRLAGLGYELVLASNRPAELAAAASAMRRDHGATVHEVALDLAGLDAATALHERVLALGVDVDVLVLNAGFFFFGEAVDADPARAAAMLQLHVVTPSLLCTLFGRRLREKGRGYVLVTSSMSAWRDMPGIAYYASSKKYLRGFACALRSELGVYGVSVTCLAPGATATGLYDPDVVPVERARRLGVMKSAEEVAEAGLAAMFAGRAEVVPGTLTRAMAVAAAWTPQFVIDLVRRRAPWLPAPGRPGRPLS